MRSSELLNLLIGAVLKGRVLSSVFGTGFSLWVLWPVSNGGDPRNWVATLAKMMEYGAIYLAWDSAHTVFYAIVEFLQQVCKGLPVGITSTIGGARRSRMRLHN